MPVVTRALRLVSIVVITIAVNPGTTVASESDYNRWPSIASGSAASTLNEFSKQTGLEVYYVPPSLVQNVRTRPVTGNLSPRRALLEMLRDTGLTFDFINAHAVEIVRRNEAEAPLDSLSPEVIVQGEPSSDRARNAGYGVSVKDIDLSGLNSIADLLRSYPWNTGGGCYDDLVNITREARTNSTLACGVNLRGIGPSGTTVLINGRRVAFGGTAALFGDVSRIPVTAIETVQITQDGSYTLYGGDVIAGVANFILRQEFEGIETRVRWAPGIGGRVGERLFSQSMGAVRGSGSGSASFEFYHRDALPAADRLQGTSNLTPWGGANYGTPFGTPSNIAFGSQFLAPPTLFDRREGTDLLPSQTSVSAFFTGALDVSHLSEVRANALITWRQVTDHSTAQGAALSLTHDNPYYSNPAGGTDPETVYYGFLHSLGPSTLKNSVWNGDFDLTATAQLDSDWKMEYSTGYSFETQDEIVSGLFNPFTLATAVTTGAFNPFGNNDVSVLQSIGSRSQFLSTSALARGSMAARRSIPAGWLDDINVISGVEYRFESFDSREQAGSYAPVIGANRHRNVASAFSQICVPFRTIGKGVCDDGGSTVSRRPQLTVGVQYEYFGGFGFHWAPAAQLLWSPVNALTLKGNWSRSSKPPGLPDLTEADNVSQIITLPNPPAPSQVSSALLLSGANSSLQRETSETWTAGLVYRPDLVPGLAWSLEYYDLDDRNRVDQPAISSDVLTSRLTEDLVTLNPSPAQRETVCSHSQFSGSPGDCLRIPIDALVDGRLHNVSRLETRGVDFGVAQKVDGWFLTSWDLMGTYILKYLSVEPSGAANLVSLPGYPDQFRMHARVVLERSSFDAALMAQYANGYHDFLDRPNRGVASWTTVDFHFKWKFGGDGSRGIDNLDLSLDVRNLFNRDPPFVNSAVGVGFDSANGSVWGRSVTVGASKRW